MVAAWRPGRCEPGATSRARRGWPLVVVSPAPGNQVQRKAHDPDEQAAQDPEAGGVETKELYGKLDGSSPVRVCLSVDPHPQIAGENDEYQKDGRQRGWVHRKSPVRLGMRSVILALLFLGMLSISIKLARPDR